MHEVVSPDTCIMYLIHKHQAYLSKRAHRGPRFRNSYSSGVSRVRDNSCPTSSIRFYGKFPNQFIFHVSFHDFDAPIPLCKSFFAEKEISSRDPYLIFIDILISPFIFTRNFAEIWRDIVSDIARDILGPKNLHDVFIAHPPVFLEYRSFVCFRYSSKFKVYKLNVFSFYSVQTKLNQIDTPSIR